LVDAAEGDRLDLSPTDADTALPGDQAFLWRGTQPFDGAGQARYLQQGDCTWLRLNIDADLQPEMEIQLVGLIMLTASNLVL
jgi:hypothetical protein